MDQEIYYGEYEEVYERAHRSVCWQSLCYLETDILTDIRRGIHTVTRYYFDGRVEVRHVPKGRIFIPSMPLPFW